ncbi:winged helix-turn-helix domain-containing protein [Sphingomonas sp. DBB INV C78]|uniref:winged helix-turn-helix domain-containing protein n=1 Tax=Sphingomonas sp. DBB INV C78 TaxID=3349434 RepID=UPI0036D397EF
MAHRSLSDVSPMADGNGGNGVPDGAVPLARRGDFTLGAATVRPSVRTVDGPGGSAMAEPRVMQVLLALADAGGAVLTRDDLVRTCWDRRIVGDDSISRAIAEVRRIARETSAGFGIETIPRIGYRLMVDGEAHGPSVLPADGGPALSRRTIMAAGLAAAGISGGLWWYRQNAASGEADILAAQSQQALRLATPEGDSQAIALLDKAVRLRGDDGALWGKLALARARAQEHSAPPDPVRSGAAIENAVRQSLGRDPRNADAHAAMALLVPYYGDWLAAERKFDAVLAIDPGHVAMRDARAFLLNAVGRWREGSSDRIAFSRNEPLDAGLQFRLIYASWILGRVEEADRVANRAMELWPRHPGVWFGKLWLLACTGRLDRALAHIQDTTARPPLPPTMVATLAASVRAAAAGGQAVRADAAQQILAQASKSPAAVINGMMLLNILGDLDQAFHLAEAYYLERGPILAAMQWRPGQPVVNDQRRRKTNMLFVPVAAPMQRDPRFAGLMEAMGLADYWRKRGIMPDYLKQPA